LLAAVTPRADTFDRLEETCFILQQTDGREGTH